MNQVIEFFKYMDLYNEHLFNDIIKKTKVYPIRYEEMKDIVGCYPIYQDNQMIDFKLILPKINSVNDVLIYIHEYTHAVFLDENELFPNIMEAIFINKFCNENKQ